MHNKLLRIEVEIVTNDSVEIWMKLFKFKLLDLGFSDEFFFFRRNSREMRAHFLILFAFVLQSALAQEIGEFTIRSEGITWKDQPLEKGLIVESQETVLKSDYDEKNNLLYVITHKGTEKNIRNRGQLTCLDLTSGNELWKRPFHAEKDGFLLVDTIPIVFSGRSSWALNWRTEEDIWRVKGQLVSSTSNGRVAIGLEPSYDEQYQLMAVDVHSGKELWSKSLVRDQYLNDIKFLNDTAWVVNNKGLDYTDVRTGEGFFHKTKLFEEEKLGQPQPAGMYLGPMFLGVSGALIYLAFSAPPGVEATTAGTQTTLAIENGQFFLLDPKRLYKINLDGTVLWETKFQSTWRDPDRVFASRTDVFVVNDGYKRSNYGYSRRGISGIQKFGIEKGTLKLQRIFDEPIEDYITKDSTIVLVLSTAVVELNLSNFQEVNRSEFKNGERLKNGLDKIMNPPLYIRSDGEFLNSEKHYKDYFYVLDNEGDVFEFDKNFDLVRRMNPFDVYEISRALEENDFIITNGSENKWIRSNGKEILPFSFSSGLKVLNSWVLDQSANEVLLYPLN